MPPINVLESWPTPNYIDPVMRGPANIIVVAIFFPLALLTVGIRIYTRIRLSRSFGVDDWFIIATLFPTTTYAIFTLVAELHFGWNRHIWDVQLDTITIGLKIIMATEILFCFATSLTKISMLTLTYRLVANSSTLLSKVIIGAITLVSAQGVTFCLGVLLQCRIPSLYWTLSFAPQPECLSETKMLLAAGIVNTVTDAIVVILPMPTVWRVKLPIQQQIVLAMLFATGFLITLTGALRTYYLYKVTTGYDKTWEAFPVWLTSSVELYVGIICASVPATKRFFNRFVPITAVHIHTHKPRTRSESFLCIRIQRRKRRLFAGWRVSILRERTMDLDLLGRDRRLRAQRLVIGRSGLVLSGGRTVKRIF
ncbi:hypothetical protein BDZ45DRAFT_715582 [Acephala macrosclerotiorum]|nr:hypothetical protein BDZ45DRAFT_715582 [Acephala macrosclerotiorum]